MKKSLLFLLLFCYFFSFSQTRIEIKQAEELRYNKNEHQARKLIGNVILKHDNALMYCDSAYLYEKTNILDAFNNVKIIQGDSILIRGDYLNYNGNSKLSLLEGNITMVHNNMRLTTNKLKYNKETEQAYYYTGAVISIKDNLLESEEGVYNSLYKMAYFKKDVFLTNERLYY